MPKTFSVKTDRVNVRVTHATRRALELEAKERKMTITELANEKLSK